MKRKKSSFVLIEENFKQLVQGLATLKQIDDVQVLVQLSLGFIHEEISSRAFASPLLFSVLVFKFSIAPSSEEAIVFKGVFDSVFEVAPVHDTLVNPVQLLFLWLSTYGRVLVLSFLHCFLHFVPPKLVLNVLFVDIET